jgi:hypothetical protein
MRRKRKHDLELTITVVEENGRPEMYVVAGDKRIAKRGHPDTPQAMTWISLEPGWVVRDHDYPYGIEVERRKSCNERRAQRTHRCCR